MKKQKIFVGLIRLSLVIAILGSIYELNWMALFVSSLALILSFIPWLLRKKYDITLPNSIQLFIILFIYASLFLGELREFYFRFWWWDSLLHLLSGIALGFAGFLIMYILFKTGKFKANPAFIALFAFCFAMTLGVLWEIFEFFVDQFFNMNMQKARGLCEQGIEYCNTRLGVIDTMIDLILDAVGALIASVSGYLYLKNKKIPVFTKLVNEFESLNKKLFKK